MRISDWSSDVCSSDLLHHLLELRRIAVHHVLTEQQHLADRVRIGDDVTDILYQPLAQRLQLITGDRQHCRRERGLAGPLRNRAVLVAGALRADRRPFLANLRRSEAHTSELQSLMRLSSSSFFF